MGVICKCWDIPKSRTRRILWQCENLLKSQQQQVIYIYRNASYVGVLFVLLWDQAVALLKLEGSTMDHFSEILIVCLKVIPRRR